MAPEETAFAAAAEIDEVTFRRAQRGDEGACRELVRRYERPVFALLGRMLGPAGRGALVEDLAQETFLRLFRELEHLSHHGPARLSTWILTVATRLALDEVRRPGPQTEPLDRATDLAAPDRTDARADRRALAVVLARAVAALAPESRAVLLLREYHELRYEEIARALELDVGTVKSRLSRARAALREALAEGRHA